MLFSTAYDKQIKSWSKLHTTIDRRWRLKIFSWITRVNCILRYLLLLSVVQVETTHSVLLLPGQQPKPKQCRARQVVKLTCCQNTIAKKICVLHGSAYNSRCNYMPTTKSRHLCFVNYFASRLLVQVLYCRGKEVVSSGRSPSMVLQQRRTWLFSEHLSASDPILGVRYSRRLTVSKSDMATENRQLRNGIMAK